MTQTVIKPMVPGGGIEPPTRGFSIPVQFNENSALACKRSVDRCGTKRDSVNTRLPFWPHNRALQYLQQVQANVLRGVLKTEREVKI